MNWIIQAVLSFFLDKIWGVATDLFGRLVSKIKSYFEYSKIKKENKEQAAKVVSAADEIRKLLSEGKEVPEELKQRLKDESDRLINNTFDPDSV